MTKVPSIRETMHEERVAWSIPGVVFYVWCSIFTPLVGVVS